jgi:E3 ubiquitin-protein ligase HERC4
MEHNSSSSLVYGWGNMTHGQLGLGGIEEEQIYSARQLTALSGRRIKDIASGVEHTVFLLEDGSVYSCGNNDHGQLGHDKARRRPGS